MADYTSQDQVIKAIKKDGFIVLEGIKKDPVASLYLKDVKFMEKVVAVNKAYFSYAPLTVAREMLKKDGSLLKNASVEAKNDGLAVFNAIAKHPDAILDGAPKFLNSEEHALEAVKGKWQLLEKVNARFTKREPFATAALKQDLNSKNLINKNLIYNNASIFETLVKETKFTKDDFKKFNKGMLADSDVCTKLIRYYGKENANLPKLFRGAAKRNQYVAIDAITQNSNSYKKLYHSLRKNEEVNRTFVSLYPEQAKKIGKEIYKPSVASALVAQNGLYLKKFVTSFLIDEPNLILSAVSQNGAAFKYAAKAFRKYKQIEEGRESDHILLAAVRSYKGPIPKKGQTQEEATKNAKNPMKDHPLYYASKKYRKDPLIMAESAKEEPLSLALADKKIRADKEICLEPVSANGKLFKYLSKELQRDDQMIISGLKSSVGSEEVVKIIGKKYLKDEKNEQILIDSLGVNPHLYDLYPAKIQEKPETILMLIEKRPELAVKLPLEYRQSKSFLQKLAKINTDAYEIAVNSTYKVQADASFMREMEAVLEELKVRQGKKVEKKEVKQLETQANEAQIKKVETQVKEDKTKKVENSMYPVKKENPIEESKTIIDVAKNFKFKENNNKQAVKKGEYEIEIIGNKNSQDLDEGSKRKIAHAVILKDVCEIKKFNTQEQQDEYTKNILTNMIPVVDAIENEIWNKVQKAKETGENIEFNAKFLDEIIEKSHNNFKHAESITTNLLNSPLGWKVLVEHVCPDVSMSEIKFSARKDLGKEIDTSSDIHLKDVSIKVNTAVKTVDSENEGVEPK